MLVLSKLRKTILSTLAYFWRKIPPRLRWSFLHLTQTRFLMGALAIVPDQENKILILNHRFRVPYPWGLPGGFIKRKEHIRQGLCRELQEETGLTINPHRQPIIATLEPNAAHLTLIYVADPIDKKQMISFNDRSEILGGRFVGADDMPELLHPAHKKLLQYYWRQNGNFDWKNQKTSSSANSPPTAT